MANYVQSNWIQYIRFDFSFESLVRKNQRERKILFPKMYESVPKDTLLQIVVLEFFHVRIPVFASNLAGSILPSPSYSIPTTYV